MCHKCDVYARVMHCSCVTSVMCLKPHCSQESVPKPQQLASVPSEVMLEDRDDDTAAGRSKSYEIQVAGYSLM